jgi:NADH-quinone oxidoreductase subunit E
MTRAESSGMTVSLGLPTVLKGSGAADASVRAAPKVQFPDELREQAKQIIARFPADRSRSALLPLLHLVQSYEGYVSPDGIGFCAEQLELTRAEVAAVSTFYTMYKREPSGDWLVSVCTNTMCDVLGGGRVFEMVSEYLGVGHNETTADGTITVEHAECLAACDYGPVMTVNYEFFDQVSVESALDVVTQLQEGKRPRPTRGARLCTLKEMSVQLAGFSDERPEALADGVAGPATLRGLKLAEQAGISVAPFGGADQAGIFDPETPIVQPPNSDKPLDEPVKDVPAANKAASDGKPAGDAPAPSKENK